LGTIACGRRSGGVISRVGRMHVVLVVLPVALGMLCMLVRVAIVQRRAVIVGRSRDRAIDHALVTGSARQHGGCRDSLYGNRQHDHPDQGVA